MTPSGKYLYLYAYEEIDALGELHQGPISAGTLVTMGGGDNRVTHAIPTLRLTGRRQVRIAVYRSDFNVQGTIDQIDFHRVTSTDPNSTGDNCYLSNDPTQSFVAWADGMSDAIADTKEPCYANGGILSNDPAPYAGTAIANGKSRLFWLDPSDPNLVRYSQQVRDETALEAPSALSLRADPYGGDFVAIGVMDGGVFGFKDTSIYVADGPGPDADGGKTSNNAFTPFALLTSDVGCKSIGSICQTPMGIVFQSSKGIKLLGRDRQVQDIGRPVYSFNAQKFVRATLLPDRHAVVFLTDSGFTLLWDYERNQWSKFTNHEGLDAVVVGGSYHYLRNDGRVFVETPGVYVDDNSHIRMVIETAPVKPGQLPPGLSEVALRRGDRLVQVEPSPSVALPAQLRRRLQRADRRERRREQPARQLRRRQLRRRQLRRRHHRDHALPGEVSPQQALPGDQLRVLRRRAHGDVRGRVRTVRAFANRRRDRREIPGRRGAELLIPAAGSGAMIFLPRRTPWVSGTLQDE